MSSRYLDRFRLIQSVEKESKPLLTLIGNEILVERLDMEPPKTKGGLYLPSANAGQDSRNLDVTNKPLFAHVLRVGAGYYDPETKEVTELETQPGNIVLLPALGTEWFSILPFTGYIPQSIGRSTEDNIKWRFDTLEDFKEYFKLLEG